MTTAAQTAPSAETARRLTREQLSLVEEHLGYAEALAREAARTFDGHDTPDELRSAAYLGLVQAARMFDRSLGYTFKTYATGRIRGAIADEFRRIGTLGFGKSRGYVRGDAEPPIVASLATPLGDCDRTLADLLASGDGPIGWAAESEDEVERLASLLPPSHGDVVRLLYLWADTIEQQHAAEFLGVSYATVSVHHTKAIRQLRNYFRMRGQTA